MSDSCSPMYFFFHINSKKVLWRKRFNWQISNHSASLISNNKGLRQDVGKLCPMGPIGPHCVLLYMKCYRISALAVHLYPVCVALSLLWLSWLDDRYHRVSEINMFPTFPLIEKYCHPPSWNCRYLQGSSLDIIPGLILPHWKSKSKENKHL